MKPREMYFTIEEIGILRDAMVEYKHHLLQSNLPPSERQPMTERGRKLSEMALKLQDRFSDELNRRR